ERVAGEVRRERAADPEAVRGLEAERPRERANEMADAAEQEDDDEPRAEARDAADDGVRARVPNGPDEEDRPADGDRKRGKREGTKTTLSCHAGPHILV